MDRFPWRARKRKRAGRSRTRPSLPLAVGDPAGMLRRRPDIRRTERQIGAANAQIRQSAATLSSGRNLIGNADRAPPDIVSIGSLAAST